MLRSGRQAPHQQPQFSGWLLDVVFFLSFKGGGGEIFKQHFQSPFFLSCSAGARRRRYRNHRPQRLGEEYVAAASQRRARAHR
jgi:hypothetical protein